MDSLYIIIVLVILLWMLKVLGEFFAELWASIVRAKANRSAAILKTGATERASALRQLIPQSFLIQSCPRCYEYEMALLEISTNGRSVQYQCIHCGKKLRSPAGSNKGQEAAAIYNDFSMAVDALERAGIEFESPVVLFEAPPAPLPYERTQRERISEEVRSAVWRRDGGRCVRCNTNQNLQFDHIIPIAKGGATTVENLQILCRQCNLSKHAKI